jgi:hypothetical protein
MWAPSNDIGREAVARLLSSADFSPANSRERNFDAPAPRVFMLAFAPPTQIKEATCRRPMSERAAENRGTCFVPSDIESEIEIARFARRRKTWVNSAFCVLHSEAHRLV